MANQVRVIVGWIAYGIGQLIDEPFPKLFLLAAARALP